MYTINTIKEANREPIGLIGKEKENEPSREGDYYTYTFNLVMSSKILILLQNKMYAILDFYL